MAIKKIMFIKILLHLQHLVPILKGLHQIMGALGKDCYIFFDKEPHGKIVKIRHPVRKMPILCS